MVATQPHTEVKPNGRLPSLVLDSSLFAPLPDELDFLKRRIGIEDLEDLKQHIVSVQGDAWQVANYVCIQTFGFTTLKISFLSPYQTLLDMTNKKPSAIYLDLGCCFGNDIRKAVSDGYPIENCIASDIKKEFWDLGHKLFRSTQETFPVPFVPGDIFDANHIAPVPPFYSTPLTSRPTLSNLTSLTPLQGHVSAIHSSSFFHLFDGEHQVIAAKALASLLSPDPGSMIFGEHTTLPESGDCFNSFRQATMECIGPSDWEKLWKGIFSGGEIEVETIVRKLGMDKGMGRCQNIEDGNRVTMEWCVRRL